MTAPTFAPDPPHPVARFLGVAGSVFLGLVLLVAAWAKMLDPAAFAELIELEGLDVLLSAQAVAMVAIVLEVALGLALVLAIRRWWVLVPAALLVAFFVFLNARAWYLDAHGLREEEASCGCFGKLVERTPEEAFWQDLLLLVPALGLSFLGRPRSADGETGGVAVGRLALVGVLTAGAAVFTWKAPDLPLDDLATRLKPGVEVEDLCAGSGPERVCMGLVAPELAEGEHLVMMVDVTDEAFVEAVPALNDYVFAAEGPSLWSLVAAEPEELTQFRWSHGPVFEIREAPPTLLEPLYRKLPRSFLVRDGRVAATYPGLPPQITDS